MSLSEARRALDGSATALTHEATRLALVVRAAAEAVAAGGGGGASAESIGPASAAAAGTVADAAARFVFAVQLCSAEALREVGAGRGGGGGGEAARSASSLSSAGIFLEDVRVASGALLRAVAELGQASALTLSAVITLRGAPIARGSAGAAARAAREAVLRGAAATGAAAGGVIQASDAISKLPTTPFAAVRRRLLSTARLVRLSATEIREEHSANDCETREGAVIEAGVGALKATMALVKAALDGVDAAAAARPPPAAPAAPAAGEGSEGGAAAQALTSALAGLSLAEAEATVDAIASAVQAVHSAVIDLAAAVNDVGEEETDKLDIGDDVLEEEDEDEDDDDDEEEEGDDNAAGGAGGGGAGGAALTAAAAETLTDARTELGTTATAVRRNLDALLARAVKLDAAQSNPMKDAGEAASRAAADLEGALAALDGAIRAARA
jgi:trimeric autotransporter adhesin